MGLQFRGQRTGNQRGKEHDQKGNWVSAVIGMQRKPGFRKKEIECQHTDDGGNKAADRTFGGHGNQHDPQNIKGNDIGLRQAPIVKQESYDSR